MIPIFHVFILEKLGIETTDIDALNLIYDAAASPEIAFYKILNNNDEPIIAEYYQNGEEFACCKICNKDFVYDKELVEDFYEKHLECVKNYFNEKAKF